MRLTLLLAVLSASLTVWAGPPKKAAAPAAGKKAPAPAAGKPWLILGVGHPGLTNLKGAIGLSRDGGKTFKEVWYSDSEGTSVERVIYVPEKKLFVGVGRVGIITSPDGENWKVAKLPEGATHSELHSVAYGNGWYVAVGNQTNIIVSKDAQTWVAGWTNAQGGNDVAKANAFSQWFTDHAPTGPAWGRTDYADVGFFDGKFYAVGSCHRVLEVVPTDSGATFASVQDLDAEDCTKAARRIRQYKDTLVLVGTRGFVSKDKGATWKELRALKASGDKWVLAVGPKGYLTGSIHGNFHSSADGEKWTELPKMNRATPHDLAWIQDKFVMVGRDAYSLWTTVDGAEWEEPQFKVESEEPKMTQSYTGILGVPQ
ncbi:MAG: hypothetical protein IT380_19490 [Myxococcales bacterium]|nr:hypothetical protein [Myxococcales bacterium]